MSRKDKVSDELLNAFVDNELDKAERERIFELSEQDPLLAQRLCELTRIKELVRAARPQAYDSSMRLLQRVRSGSLWSYAAMLLLCVSAGVLVYFSEQSSIRPGLAQSVQTIVEQHANTAEIKVVMRITRSDAASFARLLDQAEALVTMSEQLDKPVRVEVVAIGKGLSLLRADQSTHAQRIQHMRRQYDNLLFVACQETLDKQQKKAVRSVRLLPGVVIVHSGAGEIKLRRSQGWSLMEA